MPTTLAPSSLLGQYRYREPVLGIRRAGGGLIRHATFHQAVPMTTGWMEAFTDGVIAILITVMVLELKQPDGTSWEALRHEVPVLLAYLLSFVYLGIYWNNHHHMLSVVERATGGVLWANLHLLFWLSLVPFTTAWMSENNFPPTPTATYGITLLGAALAYYVLQTALLRAAGKDSLLARALGRDLKGRASPILYSLAIACALVVNRWVGVAIYVIVALMWLVPDRRVERLLSTSAHPNHGTT